jgi:hypothetical protein
MKNKNTYWIIGGILVVIIIIAVVYSLTRKRPVVQTVVPVNPNPNGLAGIIGAIGGLFQGGNNNGGGLAQGGNIGAGAGFNAGQQNN